MNRFFATQHIPLHLVGPALLLSLAACHHEEHGHHEVGKLQVTHPVRMDVDLTREYVARVHAIQHIELRALEKGYIEGIYVDEGQAVKKGQKMFQIMPLIYQAEYEKEKAEADFADIEYKNTELLAQKNVVSQNQLAMMKAKAAKAQAARALAKAHRSLTIIRAPFDGLMDRFHVRLGSLVDEGELVTAVSDNSKLWIYYNVPEAEYLDYKMEEKAAKTADATLPTVRFRMANGKTFDQQGVVETTTADFDHETGTIAFRATFENPDGLLRHGETGNILMTTPLKNALVIPQKSTYEVLDKHFVFILDKEHKIRAREIEIAEELPHLYVVREGLSERDNLLLEGLRKVRDGMKIEPDFREPAEVLAQLDVPAE